MLSMRLLLVLACISGTAAQDDHDHDHDHGHGSHDMQKMPDGTYVCSHCGYIWKPSEGKTFSSWTGPCPSCGQPKSQFNAWNATYDSKIICLNATHHEMPDGHVMMNSQMNPDPCSLGTNCFGYPCSPKGGDSDHDHDHDHGHGSTTAAPNTDAAGSPQLFGAASLFLLWTFAAMGLH